MARGRQALTEGDTQRVSHPTFFQSLQSVYLVSDSFEVFFSANIITMVPFAHQVTTIFLDLITATKLKASIEN